MHIVKNSKTLVKPLRNSVVDLAYTLFYKNVLYKNVETEICRKFNNVKVSYSNQPPNIFDGDVDC